METLKFAFYIAGILFFVGMIIIFTVMAFFGKTEETIHYDLSEKPNFYFDALGAVERRCKKLELDYDCEKAEKELLKMKLKQQENETVYYKEKYEKLLLDFSKQSK